MTVKKNVLYIENKFFLNLYLIYCTFFQHVNCLTAYKDLASTLK